MNKIKHIAIAISALSAMGIASVSLADCPTTISPGTSTCLSNAADTAFQQNYQNDYANLSSGQAAAPAPAASASKSNTNSTAPSSQVQQTLSPSNMNANDNDNGNSNSNSNNNSDSDSNRQPIHWF